MIFLAIWMPHPVRVHYLEHEFTQLPMKHVKQFFIYFFVGLLVTSVVSAQDRALMERMRERLPLIDVLLTSQIVGEGNRGFLIPRAELSEQQVILLEAENRDRAAAYVAISRRTESTPETVGRQRALQIRERATEGVWLQDEEGKWYRQPKRN
jgi:uncharacterized protein YdbL (DUF1318 family)